MFSTSADGGHIYIETETVYYGKFRRLTAFIKDKTEEAKIRPGLELNLEGVIEDDGINYGLLLLETEVLN